MRLLSVLFAIVALTTAVELPADDLHAKAVEIINEVLNGKQDFSESCTSKAELYLRNSPSEIPKGDLAPGFSLHIGANVKELFDAVQEAAAKEIAPHYNRVGCATNNQKIVCIYGNGGDCQPDEGIKWLDGEKLTDGRIKIF